MDAKSDKWPNSIKTFRTKNHSNQTRTNKTSKTIRRTKKCECNWIRAILQNGWMKQMSKSYLGRRTGRKRRNKKIYWTPSFMALPSMSQSHIKRDIVCDDDIFEVQSNLIFVHCTTAIWGQEILHLKVRQKLSQDKTLYNISFCA